MRQRLANGKALKEGAEIGARPGLQDPCSSLSGLHESQEGRPPEGETCTQRMEDGREARGAWKARRGVSRCFRPAHVV